MLTIDKNIITDIFTASGQVCNKPCLLYNLLLHFYPLLVTLKITGNLVPDASGYYLSSGIYNGSAYYISTNGLWFLWYDSGGPIWVISSVLGVDGSYYWSTSSGSLIGTYYAQGLSQGDGLAALVTTANVILYDGFSSIDLVKLYFNGGSRPFYNLCFKTPVIFNEGMYISFSLPVLKCLIAYQLFRKE